MDMALWIVQILLALLFLAAGAMKTFRPIPTITASLPSLAQLSPPLIRFIGVSEILGAIGLIVPLVTGIMPWLTIAAAVGLALVMILAAIFHASRKEYSMISSNVVLLLMAVAIVYGRLMLVPVTG